MKPANPVLPKRITLGDQWRNFYPEQKFFLCLFLVNTVLVIAYGISQIK